MNILGQSSNNNPKSKKNLRLISKISWLIFLKGTISFQGWGLEIEIQYQPFIENKMFTELMQNLNSTDESIR